MDITENIQTEVMNMDISERLQELRKKRRLFTGAGCRDVRTFQASNFQMEKRSFTYLKKQTYNSRLQRYLL